MGSVGLVHDIRLRSLPKVVEPSGEDINVAVQAVICNPPYHTCQVVQILIPSFIS